MRAVQRGAPIHDDVLALRPLPPTASAGTGNLMDQVVAVGGRV
jgi:hypothetical protein